MLNQLATRRRQIRRRVVFLISPGGQKQTRGKWTADGRSYFNLAIQQSDQPLR